VILLKLELVQKKSIYELSYFTALDKDFNFATYIQVCPSVPCEWYSHVHFYRYLEEKFIPLVSKLKRIYTGQPDV
jgi:hypothetical protein